MVRGLNAPDLRDKLRSQGMDTQPGTPEEFGKLIRSEIKKWGDVIKEAGIKR
jgi:tripartite-type tricarboxylate transporter receptor subunit TctC